MAPNTESLIHSPETLSKHDVVRLKALIEAHSITAVSRSCHVDPGTVSRASAGVRVRPSSAIAIAFWIKRQPKPAKSEGGKS